MKRGYNMKYEYFNLTKITSDNGIIKRFNVTVQICVEKNARRVHIYKSRIYFKNVDLYHYKQTDVITVNGGYAYGIELVKSFLQNDYIIE